MCRRIATLTGNYVTVINPSPVIVVFVAYTKGLFGMFIINIHVYTLKKALISYFIIKGKGILLRLYSMNYIFARL